jgi:hypothetical protein
MMGEKLAWFLALATVACIPRKFPAEAPDDGGHTLDARVADARRAVSDASPADVPTVDAGPADAVPDAMPPLTIRDLRTNPPVNGTVVTVPGVVVVAHVTASNKGRFWVQDPGGGAYRGIQVYCSFGSGCGYTRSEIDAVTPGMVIDLTGTFQEFALSTPASAPPIFQITSPAFIDRHQTIAPVAVDVAGTILDKSNYAAGGTADPYKGAYVHVTGGASFTAFDLAPTELQAACTDMSTPAQTGTTYYGFDMSGSGTLLIDFTFYNTISYCLPCTGVAMPYPCTNAVVQNQTFTQVQGIVEPASNSTTSFLTISPTTDADL